VSARAVALGEITETVMGQAPPGVACNKEGKGTIFVKAGEFSDIEPIVREWTTAPLKFAKKGDVLVCVVGATAGKINLGINCAIGRSVAAVRPDSKHLDTGYLNYFLRTRTDRLRAASQGLAQGVITREMISKVEIPLPSLGEQRRLAAILNKADSLRRKRERAVDLIDNLIQSIFSEMFGDPITNPNGFQISAFEALLKVSPNFGSMIPPKRQIAEWVSLRVANIQNWALTLDDSKYIDLPSECVERHTLHDGDIILARAIASEEHLGKCVVVKPAGRKWAFDSHLMRIRLNTKMIDPVYVRELFRTPGGRKIFLRSTRKTTVQYNINTKELRALKIPVPPIDLQREFVSRVQALESIQDIGSRSTRHLDRLFSALQSHAFSGQL
jgi:type I restriction enzyme S subunit